MKLCRIGKVNNEKPALIDNDGIFRDLSKTISDFDSKHLNFEKGNVLIAARQ